MQIYRPGALGGPLRHTSGRSQPPGDSIGGRNPRLHTNSPKWMIYERYALPHATLQGSVFDQPHPAVFPSIAINAHLVSPAYAWLWRTSRFDGPFRPSSALRYLRLVRRETLEIYRKKAQTSMESANCYQIWKGKVLVMGLSGEFRYSQCGWEGADSTCQRLVPNGCVTTALGINTCG